MVKFVVESEVIHCYEDKMKYLKILRAQLSNHEQMMLFYNWLCDDYGSAWENKTNHFLTQYKMIHNLWYKELYPDNFFISNINGLIDRYNQNPKKTPLFEFQGDDFDWKIPAIEKNKPLADHFDKPII